MTSDRTAGLLQGKRVLVTGGTRGIGRAISLALAAEGASVAACYRADSAAAQTLRTALAGEGDQHLVLPADVTVEDAVDDLMRSCAEQFGGLDAVVHNAGAISHVPFAELTVAEWHRVLDTNLTAAFLLAQRSFPLLKDGSSLVLIGSRGALAGLPQRAHYAAAKAGLIGLTRSLCREWGRSGVRVNMLAPGVIRTDEWDDADPARVEALISRYSSLTALGRLGRGEEIADATVFLVSDLSRYVTGECVNVDGGI